MAKRQCVFDAGLAHGSFENILNSQGKQKNV